jgi:hypothetical protein
LHDSQVDVEAYPTEDGLLVVDIENGASKIVNALAAELCLPEAVHPEDVPDELCLPEVAPPGHIPEELSRTRPAPPLNVVIQIVGSRGDVQPFVALGQVLKANYGHRVRIATHPTFKKFVEDHGLEFFSITGDPAEMMDFMVKNPGLMPKFKTIREGEIGRRRKAIFEIVEACWRSCIEPSDSALDIDQNDDTTVRPFIADAIIANPPSFAHIHCAEKLGIPIHMMFTYVTISSSGELLTLPRNAMVSYTSLSTSLSPSQRSREPKEGFHNFVLHDGGDDDLARSRGYHQSFPREDTRP